MKFECGDLERALANPDLMPEARQHLSGCQACRQEYRLWLEISSTARELREEWETPLLWPRIRQSLAAERKPEVKWWKEWRTWAIAASVALIAVATSLFYWPHTTKLETKADQNRDFLTEQALVEVEKNEAAYRQSIERLSRLAEPKLENASSAAAVNTREKLVMLDAAIADTRSNVASNRFNLRLQTTLAELYREKQQTLKELLTSDRNN